MSLYRVMIARGYYSILFYQSFLLGFVCLVDDPLQKCLILFQMFG